MSLIDCPRCLGRYVDPSPVAALNPRPCPYCTGNTSAAPTTPDLEGYEKALVGGEPAGWMSKAQFEELRRKLMEGPC